MAKQIQTIADYIAAQPKSAQPSLKRVRSAIRKAIPQAEELISYKMPAYRLRGEVILYFAGWKQHYSLYAASGPVVAAFKEELRPYKISKGTISFPLNDPVPVDLIERIAKFRARSFHE
jgi:uncharacterized protein YdhG (YjbR/CyaY superfamily)